MHERESCQAGKATGATANPHSPKSIEPALVVPSRAECGKESEKKVRKQLSLPNLPKTFDQERSITPCERDYRQLGGMRFGTLRITNASPIPGFRLYGEEEESAEIRKRHSHTSKRENKANHPPGLSPGPSSLSSAQSTQRTRESSIAQESDTPIVHRRAVSQPENSTTNSDTQSAPRSARFKATKKRISSSKEPIEHLQDDSGRGPLSSHPFIPVEYWKSRKSNHSNKTPPYEGSTQKYSAKETLHVRHDPSARTNRKLVRRGVPNQSIQRDITRVDSGLASPGFSMISRRTLSNADSAYSSNASTHSHTLSAEERPSTNARASNSSQESMDRSGLDVFAMNDSFRPDTAEDGLTSARSVLISKSTSHLRRLSSTARWRGLRTSVFEPKEYLKKSSSWRFSEHDARARDSAVTTGPPNFHLRDYETSVESTRSAMLQGFLGGSKRENDVKVGFANHDAIEVVPQIPQDVEERFKRHITAFPTTSMKLTKQQNISTDSLTTIISIPGEVRCTERNYSRSSYCDVSSFDGESTKSHKSQNSIESADSISSFRSTKTLRSLAFTTNILSPPIVKGNLIDFQSEMSVILPISKPKIPPKQNDAKIPKSASLHWRSRNGSKERNVSGSWPHHVSYGFAFRSKKVKVSIPSYRKTYPSNLSSPIPDCHGNPSRFHGSLPVHQQDRTKTGNAFETGSLKSRASAPNLRDPHPEGHASLDSTYVPGDLSKELPLEPVQKPTLRSVFSRRRLGEERDSNQSILTSSTNINEEYQWRGYSINSGNLRSQSQVDLGQYSGEATYEDVWAAAIKRKHSTLLQRPAFSEAMTLGTLKRHTKGSQPHYRVLHSYNSPAYRNIPIWG